MRDDDNQYLHDFDDRGTSRRLRGNEVEEARQRLAASAGYVDPVETPRAPSTPRLQRNTPFGRPANSANRIASIKRGGKARSASPMTGPSTFTPNTFTATPSSFSFGAQQAQQQPNPGFGASEGFAFGQQQPSEGNGMDRIEQSSTPAPAASFTFGQSQPQQPVSNGFGQQNNNPFGGFGQQSATPTNGAQTTPSFSFGAQTQNSSTGNAPSNPFGGFGQQTQTTNTAPTSFAFGAQSQSSSPAPTQNPFSGFNSQPQQNGTATPSNSFTFGAQPANNQPSANGSTAPSFGAFGATQPAQPSSQQPASTLANGSATPSFGAFGATQPAQPSTQPPASSLSSLFAPQPSTEHKSPSPFQGSTSLFSKPAETPKADASANGSSTPSFGAFGTTQPAPQQTTSSLFAPKPSTEQKSPSLFSGSTSLFSKPAETPKADGWSSFKTTSPAPTAGGEASGASVLSGWQKEQTSKTSFSFSQDQMPTGDVDDDDAMASPEKSTPAQPASSAFGGGSNLFGGSKPAATTGNDLFSRISKPTETNGTSAEQSTDSAATPKAPTSSGGDLFSRMSFPDKAKDQTVSATPAPKASNPFSGFSAAPPATAPAKSLFAGVSNGFGVPSTPTPAAEKAPDTPATARPTQTSSTNQAANRTTTTDSKKFDPANASAMRQLNEGLLQRLAQADPDVDYTKVLEYYIRKAKAISNLKGQSIKPHGAGVKHSIEIDNTTAPTEKRRKSKETIKETVEYPKLPAGASNTAKFFEAALDKPAESGAAARSLFAPQSAITTTESKDVEQTPKASTFGGAFMPSTSSLFSPANTATQTPKAQAIGAFKPSTSSLFSPATAAAPTPKPSTFGAVQPATSLFTPAKTASSESNGHSNFVASSLFAPKPAAGAAKPKPAVTGGFMPTFAAPPAVGSNFLSAFGQNASKEQDQARKKAMDEDFDSEDDDPVEWKKQYEEKQAAKRKAIEDAAKSGGGFSIKPPTPAAATNGASLFSTNSTTESPATKPAEAEGEEDAANDPQVEDMTSLQPGEKDESDILYHIEKAKSYKFEQKANADKPDWVYKALGPVWLLRNKSTGKVRLLQKVAPLGKAGMNFNLLKATNMYAQSSKKVTANFIDHINEKEPKKPSRWFVQCGKEEDAKELARLMKEESEK
jgi:hypothetical protein